MDTDRKYTGNSEIDEFSVVTYNIFFGALDSDTSVHIEQRILLLCAQIQSLDADVVCLQEVIPDRYEKIKKYLQNTYPHTYPEKITQNYDTAILSKHRFIKKSRIKFSLTNMGRSIMWVSIRSPLDPNKKLGIATSHLESEFSDTVTGQNTKLIQYAEAEDILDQVAEMSEVQDIIFCGDFNSHNEICDNRLYQAFQYEVEQNESVNWRDAWIETGANTSQQNTFDSTRNPMLKKMYSSLSNPPCYVSRLDRILHRSSLHVNRFRMIESDLLISDHFPILATFRTSANLDSGRDDYLALFQKLPKPTIRRRPRSAKAISEKLKKVSLFK